MSDSRITNTEKINFNNTGLNYAGVKTVKKDNTSLWNNDSFVKESSFKGLFVESANTPFSEIANKPVNQRELSQFIEEIGVERQWRDDFATGVKTQNELAVLKQAASMIDQNGNRLYDSFQLFQFTGEDSAKKLNLAKRFLSENPEYTSKNYNMPMINYIIKNNLSEKEVSFVIKNAKT